MMIKRLTLLSGATACTAALAPTGPAFGQTTCPPGNTGQTPYCSAASRVAPKSLTLSVTPRRYLAAPHRTTPYTFRSRGVLRFPSSVTKSRGCRGRVTVRFARRTVTISKRRVYVKLINGVCRYHSTVGLKVSLVRHRTLKVTARFTGNAYLRPKSAVGRFVRVD